MFCAARLVLGGTEGVGSLFMFRAPGHVYMVPKASGPAFMFCALGPIFHRYRRTRFRQNRAHRVPFSCVALPDSFSVVPRASGPIFISFSPGLIFSGTDGVGSRSNVLRRRIRFRRDRARRIPISCFALPESFLAVPRASGPILIFCAVELVFSGTEGVGYRFPIFRTHSLFHRNRARRVPFSCFALPDSFSAVPRASGTVFMFCSP
jgi:hypothetical protein